MPGIPCVALKPSEASSWFVKINFHEENLAHNYKE